MPRLEDLELKIKQTGSIKAGSTEKLAESLERLSAAVKSFPKTADNISNLNSAIKSIDADKAAAVAKVATAIGKLAEKASKVDANAAGNVAAIGAAIEQMIDSIDASRLDSISDALQGFKRAVSSLNGVKGTAQAVTAGATPTESGTPTATIDTTGQSADAIEETGEAAGEASTKVSGFRAALEGLKETGAKVGSALKSIGKHALSAGKNLLGMGWDSLKSKVTGLVGSIGNLWHSFARIAGYRALRTAIKAITQGFSQGIEHLYEWSRIVGNEFKNSMDSIATSAHYLRDSLGAMASPLLDALAPALEILVDKFVSLLNVANQFFAALTGKTTWRKAVRTPTEWAKATDDATDSTKKATEAQKKLNKALMDFDEIHLLTTSTTKGSNPKNPSSGGNDSGIDSTHFEEVPIASWIQDIKDAIDKGDWYGAGKLLADKLNGMLDSFDAKAFGEKIGEKVENGLKFYLGFMDNFHWETLGIKAGDFINGILSKIDPNDLGRAMVAKFQAALKFLANFAWTVDLSSLGTAFGVAFNELFSKETMTNLGKTISGAINNAIGIAYNFITTADLEEAAKNIMDSLFTTISEINWTTAGITVGKLATGLLKAIKAALEDAITHIDVVLQAIWDFVGALLGELWNYLLDGIGGLLKEFWQYVKDNFWSSGVDDGNGRKDGPVNSSTTGIGAGTDSPVNDFTQKVQVLYTSNADSIKSEIEMLDKLNAKPIITMQTKNFKVTNDTITKMTGDKTVTIYANKDSKTFNAVTKALNKLTIDRTATIKFKPTVEVSGSSGGKATTSLLTQKQLTKILSAYAMGGFPSDDLTQGSLFVAGEMPGQAEMVGNINGKTGVASGKEITGIGDAVRETGANEAALLREQNQLLRQILAKSGSVTLAPSAAAGRWVSQSQAAYARATGV